MDVNGLPDAPIFAELIRQWAQRDPDRDVLTFVQVGADGEFGESIRSYRMLWDNGLRLAAALRDAGMAAGDAFAIVMQNEPQFVDAMVASSILGTVFVPIDPRTRGDKLRYMLEFAGCRGALCAADVLAPLHAVAPALPRLEWLWVIDAGAAPAAAGVEIRSLAERLPAEVPALEIAVTDPDTPMQMLYTSGTTGDPKAILAPYARYHAIASLGPVIGLRPDDRPYTGLSLTHANAQIITLGNALKMGLCAVISQRFSKSRLWDITRRYGCTNFTLLGGMTTAIFAEPERPDDADNPVRYVLSAGMPAAIWEEFARRFGVDIFEFYGTAEGGLCMNPPGTGPVGSIGRPPPSLIARIVDEEDREVPDGTPGEIVFRNADGSVAPVRYFRNPEASAAKTRGGWFRTDDIGSRDADGWYYFHYRKGGGIRHNGDFVNPAFVERAISRFDSVDDVFVYGIDSSSGAPGEKDVVAAVVARDRARFVPQALYAHLHRELDRNAVPGLIQVLDEIPKTASEKPQERHCIELLRTQPERVYRDSGRTRDIATAPRSTDEELQS
ncbi:MAG: AMP-binding protein [Gammaproteobacteria bacterium]|nr:AMP-binding protein [Gammaproteobacteria bacterium]